MYATIPGSAFGSDSGDSDEPCCTLRNKKNTSKMFVYIQNIFRMVAAIMF